MYEPYYVSKRYPFYRSEIVRLVLPILIPLGHVHCMVKIQHLKKKKMFQRRGAQFTHSRTPR